MKLRYQSLMYAALLTLISAGIIFYRFSAIPANISFDELDSTRLALSLQHGPLRIYSPLATGHMTPYYYIIAGVFSLMGISNVALRLPSAIFGVLGPLILYTIMLRRYRKPSSAFITALLLVGMRWYFNFARFSFEATFLLFLELIATAFTLRYLESRRTEDGVASGILSAIACYSYLPGRIFFLVPTITILISLPRRRWLVPLITLLVCLLPLFLYFRYHPDLRVTQVSILTDSRLSPATKLRDIGINIGKTAGLFIGHGDMNGRHNYPGKPAINPIMAILLAGGIAIAVYRRHDSWIRYFLIFFLISLIPTLFTPPSDNPNMLRSFTALPAIAVFAGMCLDAVARRLNRRFAMPFIAVIVGIIVAYELRTYFIFQSRVSRNAFEIKCSLTTLSRWQYGYIPKWCLVRKNEF